MRGCRGCRICPEAISNYCRENEITAYDAETGPQYFQHCYGLDIGNSTAKLTKQQLDTRCSIRFLDDIFQFGYALRYSHHDYTVQRPTADAAGTGAAFSTDAWSVKKKSRACLKQARDYCF